MRHGSQAQRKAWLCAMVTSALLLQSAGVSFAEEAQEFSLDQVVVTANRIPTPVAKAAANVTVITREQIEKGHYSNLGDVLKEANGVVVTSSGGFAGAQQIVRLNGDERVSVMLDGRKIGRPEGLASDRSSVDLKTIVSLENIERIEIVKGGAAALYGSDAVGGVINIITRKGTEAKTTVDSSIGSWGARSFGLTTQGSENGFSWFVSADQKSQDYSKYKALKGSSQGDVVRWPNSEYDGRGFTMRLDKSLDDNHSFTFNFEHWNDEGGQPTFFVPGSNAAHLYNNWALTYNFDQKQPVPGFARIYSNYQSQHFENQGSYASRRQGAQYQTGWQLSNQHKVVTGIDIEKGEVLESTLENSSLSLNYQDKSITNTAFYLQDIYNPAEKWTLTSGLRYDHHSKFGSQTTPKININYNADVNTDIYLSYNKVFNAPNLDDLYYYSPGSGIYGGSFGNPDLKPETGYVVSTGVNKRISENTTIKLSLFASKINDAIDWYPANGDINDLTADWLVQNIDEQKKHGLELDIHHKLSEKYYADLGYSYIHVENTLSASPLVNGQPNGYRVKLGYNDTQWDWNVNGQSATGRDTDRFIDSSYWVWNFATNYKMSKDTTLYFNAYNLGNKAYEVNSSGSYSSSYDGRGSYPMPSRSFQMGVKYSF